MERRQPLLCLLRISNAVDGRRCSHVPGSDGARLMTLVSSRSAVRDGDADDSVLATTGERLLLPNRRSTSEVTSQPSSLPAPTGIR